jgi:hypothetical protein
MFPGPPAIPIHDDGYVSGEFPEIDIHHPETRFPVVFLIACTHCTFMIL